MPFLYTYLSNARPYLSAGLAKMRRKRFHLTTQKQMMHRSYIEAIAEETQRSVPDIASIYAYVLDELESSAEITAYLPIFAWKRVRNILKNHKS